MVNAFVVEAKALGLSSIGDACGHYATWDRGISEWGLVIVWWLNSAQSPFARFPRAAQGFGAGNMSRLVRRGVQLPCLCLRMLLCSVSLMVDWGDREYMG